MNSESIITHLSTLPLRGIFRFQGTRIANQLLAAHHSLLTTHCSPTNTKSVLPHDFNDDRPSRPGHASQAVLTLSNRADFIEGIFLSLTHWIQVVVA